MRKLITVALILSTLSMTGCIKAVQKKMNKNKVPLTGENMVYAGKWVANDGTYIQLFNDGSGNLELSNTSVTGGPAILTDSTIKIKLFGLGSIFNINEKPYEEDGQWKMVLDGYTYVKE